MSRGFKRPTGSHKGWGDSVGIGGTPSSFLILAVTYLILSLIRP